MAERMGHGEVVTFEELLRSCVYEPEALRRILVRKGILSDGFALKGAFAQKVILPISSATHR